MADYCCNMHMRDLDVDVHRWLPSEILSDIGVVVDTAESQRLAVVEDITARLIDVLGGSTVERIRHHAVPTSSAAMAKSLPLCHASPAEVCPFLSNNGGRITLDAAVPLPSFGPARQRPPLADAIQPPARSSAGGGTGVFLPRTVAYDGTTSCRTTGGYVNAAGAKPPPPRHSKQQQCPPSRQRRRGEEHESARRPSRPPRQLHDLRTHAVFAAASKPKQTPRRAAGANTAARLCPSIALPLGWVY